MYLYLDVASVVQIHQNIDFNRRNQSLSQKCQSHMFSSENHRNTT